MWTSPAVSAHLGYSCRYHSWRGSPQAAAVSPARESTAVGNTGTSLCFHFHILRFNQLPPGSFWKAMMHPDDTCPCHHCLRTHCSPLGLTQGPMLSHKKGSAGFGKPRGLGDLLPTALRWEAPFQGGWANTGTEFAGELMRSGYWLTCLIIVVSGYTAFRHPQNRRIPKYGKEALTHYTEEENKRRIQWVWGNKSQTSLFSKWVLPILK